MTFPMDPTLRPGQMGPASSGVVQRVLDSGAARVTNINETTRNGIAQLVAEGVRQGMSPAELGDVIERWSGWDEYRAELIARTELGTAYNEASLGAYADSGVTEVHITDGDEDDECAPWDDVTVPIDEAPEPLGHPNCTRDFEPVVTWTAQDAADFATEFGAPESVDYPLQMAQDALGAGETTLPEPVAIMPEVAPVAEAVPQSVVTAERDIIAQYGNITGVKFREYSQTFSADGTPLTPVIKGAHGSVSLGDLTPEQLRGAVVTHMHPVEGDLMSLSSGDVKVALDYGLKSIRAFYADGSFMELRNVSYAYNGSRFQSLYNQAWKAAKVKWKRLADEAVKSPEAMARYKEYSAIFDQEQVRILREVVDRLGGLEIRTGRL